MSIDTAMQSTHIRALTARAATEGVRFDRSGFRVQGSGFRVWSVGVRVDVSGFRFQGLGFMRSAHILALAARAATEGERYTLHRSR